MKKPITQTTFLTVIITAFLSTIFSINVNASDYDSSEDHNHGGFISDENIKIRNEMKSGNSMRSQMMKNKSLAEIQTIINIEDSAKRKAMFATHKKKMHSMMQNMRNNCNSTNNSSIGHQGEED